MIEAGEGVLGVLTAVTVFAAAVLAGLAGLVWRRRGSRAGLVLAVLLLAVAWWGLTYAGELTADETVARQRWGDLKYVGIGVLPAAWLVFVLDYTGRGRLVTSKLLTLLAMEPAVLWVLLAVPATHDLVRSYPTGATGQELPVVATGPVFWVNWTYANTLLVIGTVLLVISARRLARTYRIQAGLVVTAALLPWAANVLHNFEVGVFRRLDLTPLAFVVTGAVLVYGLIVPGLAPWLRWPGFGWCRASATVCCWWMRSTTWSTPTPRHSDY